MITAPAAAVVFVGSQPSRSGRHSCVPTTTDVMPSDAWASAQAATVAVRCWAVAALPVPSGARPVTVMGADLVPCATTVGAVTCRSVASTDVKPDTAATKDVATGTSDEGAIHAAGEARVDPALELLANTPRPGCPRRQVS